MTATSEGEDMCDLCVQLGDMTQEKLNIETAKGNPDVIPIRDLPDGLREQVATEVVELLDAGELVVALVEAELLTPWQGTAMLADLYEIGEIKP